LKWVCAQPLHYRVAEQWMQSRIGYSHPFPDGFTAISLLDDMQFLAVVLYTNFNGVNIEMHVASDGSRRWLNRAFLHEAFRYPFEQLGCQRVSGCVAARNVDALNFDLALGFKQEGYMRRATEHGDDLIILGMMREDCRFLKKERKHEQAQRAGRA
jgi:RimJ/RimL family protein N-acetyltransferase